MSCDQILNVHIALTTVVSLNAAYAIGVETGNT